MAIALTVLALVFAVTASIAVINMEIESLGKEDKR